LGTDNKFLVAVVVADKYVPLELVGVVVTDDELLVLSLLFSTTLQDLTEVDKAEWEASDLILAWTFHSTRKSGPE
jgi:hypothetical protein